jgi:hypothetical protein
MNARIDELIKQCTNQHFSDCIGGFETFDKEEFARLIVLECMEIVASSDPERNKPRKRPTTKILSKPYETIFSRIEKHFGIEE